LASLFAWYDAQREWSFAALGCRATLGLQHALITVWLQVRVLPGPPRTPTLTEISRGLTNTRGFTGAQGQLGISAGKKDRFRGRSGPSVSGGQKQFPEERGKSGQRLGSHATETLGSWPVCGRTRGLRGRVDKVSFPADPSGSDRVDGCYFRAEALAGHLLKEGGATCSGSAGGALYAVLSGINRYLERADLKLSDIFGPGLPKPEEDIEIRIRAAYRSLAKERGDWVSLTKLRPLLGNVSKAEVDTTLQRMNRNPYVSLVPDSNQKTLTNEDRVSAVRIGGEYKNLISMDEY